MQPESEPPSDPDDTGPLLQNKRLPQKLKIGLGVVIIVAILATEAALVPVMRKEPREKDFNECVVGAHYCSVNAKCIKTVESYTCSPCNEGYSGDGFNCFDVNECTDDTHNCHMQATCSNIPGSFECQCYLGYVGDGVSCSDKEKPTITVPASFTYWIATETSIPVAVSWIWTADANSGDFNVTSTHDPGDTFPPGDTTVSYTVTDAVNLMTTETFVITVAYDTENPTLTVPAGFTHWIATGTTLPVAVTWPGVTAGDNSGDYIVTSTHDPGDMFPVGNTAVSYTVTDSVGLMATDSFVITVAYASSQATIRLVGSSTLNQGRVEVFHNNEWRTVCDDFWSTNDAKVVCRSLGLPYTGAEAVSRASFGRGSGPIWLDNVACTGSESSLQECTHRGWGIHNCRHSEDAGVKCLY